jgi:hypothetical protein
MPRLIRFHEGFKALFRPMASDFDQALIDLMPISFISAVTENNEE